MKTEWMMAGQGLKGFAWVLTTLAMVLTGTGCGEGDVADASGRDPRTACVDGQCGLTAAFASDAGTAFDAGTATDAGTTSDAGTGIDAGWGHDAGDCLPAPHDPKLGTLQLQPGFVAAESAPLPEGTGPLGVTPGPTYSLYTLVSENYSGPHALYSLGMWPQLSLGVAPLLNLPTADSFNHKNDFVETDGQRIIAGVNYPGILAVYDIDTPAASTFIPLTNLTAAGVIPGAFLLTTRPLGNDPWEYPWEGEAGERETLVALRTDTAPLTQTTVATFPSENRRSFSISVSTHGVVLVSYYDPSFNLVTRVVAPAAITQAMTSGIPFSLADAPVLDAGAPVARLARHGEGVSVLRIGPPGPNSPYAFDYSDVSRFAISVTNAGATVTAGARHPIVVFPDRCTQVFDMTAIGSDLLLGVRDKNGSRLIRIQQAP
ncbi:hypothetical protein OV207_05965 [Corallococcus sp. BB11-1]|uniref:hypothetical protein n=1 Tax=Corallococcus sp. BB11-1 TaxID=2996783 RepID=UPI00226E5CB1|nr:hypothetical protein [Corallococcus sp. BB11-1]MCY1030993.1 hypothetical protein [Corallococcus sp. BB11-1]